MYELKNLQNKRFYTEFYSLRSKSDLGNEIHLKLMSHFPCCDEKKESRPISLNAMNNSHFQKKANGNSMIKCSKETICSYFSLRCPSFILYSESSVYSSFLKFIAIKIIMQMENCI